MADHASGPKPCLAIIKYTPRPTHLPQPPTHKPDTPSLLYKSMAIQKYTPPCSSSPDHKLDAYISHLLSRRDQLNATRKDTVDTIMTGLVTLSRDEMCGGVDEILRLSDEIWKLDLEIRKLCKVKWKAIRKREEEEWAAEKAARQAARKKKREEEEREKMTEERETAMREVEREWEKQVEISRRTREAATPPAEKPAWNLKQKMKDIFGCIFGCCLILFVVVLSAPVLLKWDRESVSAFWEMMEK